MFNNYLRFSFVIFCLLIANFGFSDEIPYSKSYSVVVSNATFAKKSWKDVVDALVKKHQAKIIFYDKDVEEALPELKKQFPKYVCFVAEPENLGFKWTVKTHRMMRKLDEDPYTDAIFSTITGYTPLDALRQVNATEPRIASNALITAGVGPTRYKEAYFFSTGERGLYGHKLINGKTVTAISKEKNLTKRYLEYLELLKPEIVISSGHACQTTLEMPFSRGNIVCKDGKLLGKITKDRLIKKDGQAKKIKIPGKLLKIPAPKKPIVYFAVGNCLIGDIPNKNCMALAWMGFGKANQMIGYTATTWFGMVGWGAMKIWEQSGGDLPLNEAFYFSNQVLMKNLIENYPKTANLDFDYSKGMKYKSLIAEIKKVTGTKKLNRKNIGMLWDRDVVAIYGDPAFECRLDKNYTFPSATEKVSIENKGNLYTMTIISFKKKDAPKSYASPISLFLPHRVKNVKILKGKEFKPLISDNFIMLMAPGPWNANQVYKVEFTADKI